MQARIIALIVTLLPIAAVHLAYMVSASAGLVPTCLPYTEGCASISRAAREGEAIYIFRAAMMCGAVFMLFYWWFTQLWLKNLEFGCNYRAVKYRFLIIFWLGSIGAVFLLFYVDYLGSKGDIYRFMRRYGIIFYFGLTPLAQMFTLNEAFRLKKTGKLPPTAGAPLYFQLLLLIAMLGLGLTSVTLDYLGEDTDPRENIIEWNYALLTHLYFLGSYFLWKQTHFQFFCKTS